MRFIPEGFDIHEIMDVIEGMKTQPNTIDVGGEFSIESTEGFLVRLLEALVAKELEPVPPKSIDIWCP